MYINNGANFLFFHKVLFAENYCNNYISYAYRKSKEFLDENLWKRGNDFKNQILLHNYEAGRLVSLNLKKRTIFLFNN